MTLDLAVPLGPTAGSAPDAPAVSLPPYDRTGVRVGIVHLGVGGFHRAHQALAVDELLRRGEARDWGICGVGLLPGDAAMRDALHAQDGLYTLVTKHADGRLDRWAAIRARAELEEALKGALLARLVAAVGPAALDRLAEQVARRELDAGSAARALLAAEPTRSREPGA